ncbi:DUF3761 domain-containing protein [Collimonas sp.]|jgi:hypothetical protein|uniref:DUF3761 domain-containing protein n=1 Tax=Collimonas sp. TaxID=1963772 RepID=UPI0037C169F8
MKNFIATLLFAGAACLVTHATAKKPPSGTYTQVEPNEADLTSHGHYSNKSGQVVHSPSQSKTGKAPATASAQCRDGSYSFSKHRSGTCSRHGGVAEWLQ